MGFYGDHWGYFRNNHGEYTQLIPTKIWQVARNHMKYDEIITHTLW
jgi:hypothetical protein